PTVTVEVPVMPFVHGCHPKVITRTDERYIIVAALPVQICIAHIRVTNENVVARDALTANGAVSAQRQIAIDGVPDDAGFLAITQERGMRRGRCDSLSVPASVPNSADGGISPGDDQRADVRQRQRRVDTAGDN